MFYLSIFGIEEDFKKIYGARQEKASAYICFYLPKGTVTSVEGIENLKELSYVQKCDVDISIGQETLEMTYKGQRLGPIIVNAESREQLEKYIEEILSILKIEVKALDGCIQGICWN